MQEKPALKTKPTAPEPPRRSARVHVDREAKRNPVDDKRTQTQALERQEAAKAKRAAEPAPPASVDLAQVAHDVARARHMISDLNRPKGDPQAREWFMSIPPRHDRDPDLILSAALDHVAHLVAEVAHLRAKAAENELSSKASRLDAALR